MLIGISLLAVTLIVLTVIDLAKCRLLSKAGIYYPLMLLAPAIAMAGFVLGITEFAVGGLGILMPIEESTENYSIKLAVSALANIVALLSVYIYIRGHIIPIDKKSRRYENCDVAMQKLYAAKRLIITGFSGTFLYLAVFVYLFFFEYRLYEISLTELVVTILMFLFALLVPLVAPLAILMAIVAGGMVFTLILPIVASYLLSLVTANGCIRYIIRSDKSKPMKALFIILSLIPVFNMVYGIICLKRISAEHKQNNNC